MDGPGMMTPRLLLVEDEPTSRLFLKAAAAALPAQVDTAERVSEAYGMARRGGYALWLIDANLPDGSGAELLARLRADGLTTPAIAHTATCEDEERERLLAQGFAGVAVKPLSAAAWQDAIRGALGGAAASGAPAVAADTTAAPTPIWDDDAATRALGGNPTHVGALRELFLAELPAAREQVLGAARAGDLDGLRSALHKLRASAGFVGAARLDQAVRALQGRPEDHGALQRFVETTDQTFAQAPSP